MNDTFQIPDRSSLYNIKSIYNALVAEIGRSGLTNHLVNGRLDQLQYDGAGVLRVTDWRTTGDDSTTSNLTGPQISFGVGTWLNTWLERLDPDTVYTLIVDGKNTGDLAVSFFSTPASKIYDFYDTTADTVNPSFVLEPSLDDVMNAERHQVAFTFRTGSVDPEDPAILQFTNDGTAASTLDVNSMSIVKGTFGFAHDGEKSAFMDFVRIADDGSSNSYYEVSSDTGYSWHRLMTIDPADIAAFTAAASGTYYTISQIDTKFLRKDVADTATAKITFDAGLDSSGEVNLSLGNNLVLASGDIIGNADPSQTHADFYLTVNRGDQIPVGIRYRGTKNKWQFTHDGRDWKEFGTGTGLGGGTGSSELEYYAEVLNLSGFKNGLYDLFDSNGQAGDVLATNAIYSTERDGHYISEPATLGPWVLRTQNLWDATAFADPDYDMFVHTLTNQPDNAGISVWYATAGDGTNVPAVDSTQWNAWAHNDIRRFPGVVTDFYLKFEIDATGTEFYSFGLQFGAAETNHVSVTQLREFHTVPSNSTPPTLVTVPNSGQYTPDGRSLEVYHNRARLVEGVDYDEVDGQTIRMLVRVVQNDTIEFYEKYGLGLDTTTYALFDNHAANTTTAHGIDGILTDLTAVQDWQTAFTELDATALADLSTHIDDTSGHGVDLVSQAITNHISDSTAAHDADAIWVDDAALNNINGDDVQEIIVSIDSALDATNLGGSGLGVGQVWAAQTIISTTIYTNSTGKPIQVNAWVNNGAQIQLEVNDGTTGWIIIHVHSDSSAGVYNHVSGVIPDTHQWRVSSADPIIGRVLS